MLRPYQFTDQDERVTSPLDRRQQNPFPPGQPPSFKTNVNRAKTKKWVEAKQVSYGGDDWDDYDEDDEYGVQSAVEQRAPPLPQTQQARSFTTPMPPTGGPALPRKNSFDQGDERRAFSATIQPPAPSHSPGPPLHVDTAVNSRTQQQTDSASSYSQSGIRQASAASFAPSATSDTSVNPENRRDFSPSAMPPPLKTAAPTSGPQSPVSPNKALPFVRPADIYRRMEEEREKERKSLDSSRPSLDSSRDRLQPGRTDSPGHSSGRRSGSSERPEPAVDAGYRMGAPLETVAERKSEYIIPTAPVATASTAAGTASGFPGLSLPTFEQESSFGSFWEPNSSTSDPSKAVTATPQPSSLQHQPSAGYRSMVNQAFDEPTKVSKQDSTRSQAPTESSGITRSDTSGTTDISPIMSRVPSSAASAMKHAQDRDTPPVIREEPEGDERGRSRPTSQYGVPANVTPGYRRDLNPPSGNNSPARSPAVESRRPISDPVAAEILSTPVSAKAADISFREADLANAMASNSNTAIPPVAALEKAAQDNFITSHDVPVEASPRISRSESPTKGRVADLAGKFNEVDSRRNSQISLGSKQSDNSLQEKASRPSSSHGISKDDKPLPERPVVERDISFRPKLPGGFESYASTADSDDQSNKPPAPTTKNAGADSLQAPTSTATKSTTDESETSKGPLAALAAAGAAVGAALSTAIGTERDSDAQQPSHHGRAVGDIYARPLPPDRLESTASTVPPTPPAKDEPGLPLASAVSNKEKVVPPKLEHRDTNESSGDFESDRIRRDIVRSLSPIEDKKQDSDTLAVPASRAPSRQSDVILSEYESYWAGSDDEDEPPKMTASALPSFSGEPLAPKSSVKSEKVAPVELPAEVIQQPVTVAPSLPSAAPVQPSTVSPGVIPGVAVEQSQPDTRPGFLTQRFSWEATPADTPAKEVTQASAMDPLVSTVKTEPAAEKLRPADPLSLNPKLSSEHLQIRNAEPGELPTPEEARPSLDSIPEAPPKASGERMSTFPETPMRDTPMGPRPPSSHKPQDPSEVRPPSFREILAIKSTSARIAKYNETRLQFANMDSGLQYWLKRTVDANPQLRETSNVPHRPSMAPTLSTGSPAGARHKATASISRVFSGQGERISAPIDSTPEYRPQPSAEQRASAAAIKGKDLLNKAGVLGGKGMSKGMKEAKGLFAKGKSRFRSSGSEKAYPETQSRRSSCSSLESLPSIFSVTSRRSSLDSINFPIGQDAFLTQAEHDLLFATSTDSDAVGVKSEGHKREPSEPPWSDDWLQENIDVTIFALFSKTKAKLARDKDNNSKAGKSQRSSSRPQTPKAESDATAATAAAPPDIPINGRGGILKNGAAEEQVKGILKNGSVSNGALATLPSRQAALKPQLLLNVNTTQNGHQRIVSMDKVEEDTIAGARNEPPSPVSPVEDEEKLPMRKSEATDAAACVPQASRTIATAPKLTIPNGTHASSGNRVSPALQSMTSREIGGSESQYRPVFAPSNEPKGKERAVGPETPLSTSTPTTKHIRFDSSTFHHREKEAKLQKPKKDDTDASTPLTPLKSFLPFMNSTPRSAKPPQQLPQKAPQHRQQAQPATGILQRRPVPESGTLTSLHRADSQYDRMAAIANAHRLMREQFDDCHDVNSAPPDLMASETAARMRVKQQEMNNALAGGIVPIPEGRPTSSNNRSRASSLASISEADRSRSRDSRPMNGSLLGDGSSPAGSRSSSANRLSSMPRLPTTGGPRANSIPRPESVVGQSGHRRSSFTGSPSGSRPSSRDGAAHKSIITITSPVNPSPISPFMGQSTHQWSAGRNSLPSQQRPVSNLVPAAAQSVPIPPRNASPADDPRQSQGTPTMIITSPEQASPPEPPVGPSSDSRERLGSQSSAGARSQASVSSLGDGTDRTMSLTPTNSTKPPVSPVKGNPVKRPYPSPHADHERPMSFIPLARDGQGRPVEEAISTTKHPIESETGEIEEEIARGRQSPKAINYLRNPSKSKAQTDIRTPSQPEQKTTLKDKPQRALSIEVGSDADEDDLYKPPTPRAAVTKIPVSTTAGRPASRDNAMSPLRSNPTNQQPIQLYDRPFSRDDTSRGSVEPATTSIAQSGPDANPIANLYSTPTTKKGGLFSKLKGKPQSIADESKSTHSQQSSRDTNNSSANDQRLSSMTSTTASVEPESKEKKRSRASGFFSLKRPSSANSENSSAIMDDTTIPPHNQIRLSMQSTSSTNGVAPSAPLRAATTSSEAMKKKGTSLGGLFSRRPTSQSPIEPPKKLTAKETVFHRVPDEPPQNGWPLPHAPKQQQFSGPRSRYSQQPPQRGNQSALEDDLYSPDGQKRTRTPSFVHDTGASGMAAIAAQQESRGYSVEVTSEGADTRSKRRSMSLTGSGLFGRKRTDSSPSTRDRSSSVDSTKEKRRSRRFRMGSITESGSIQHQERPWAITLPGADDNDERAREIERQEIMHASSARWQRGSDGQMYALHDQVSSPSTQTTSTPITPHQRRTSKGNVGNAVFSYLPSGVPDQQDTPRPDSSRQQTPREYTNRISVVQRVFGDPDKYDSYQPAAPGQPVIPPLAQDQPTLMQPQPRRTSWQAGVNDPRTDPTYRSSGGARSTSTVTTQTSISPPRILTSHPPGGPPRLDLPTASPLDLAPSFPTQSPNSYFRTATTSNHIAHHLDTTANAGASQSTNFIASLEEERRKHGEHTAMGYSASRKRSANHPGAKLHVSVPKSTSPVPKQVGMFEDTSAAVASAGASARPRSRGRRESESSDDEVPVMKATSYPGQEWMPEFYVD